MATRLVTPLYDEHRIQVRWLHYEESEKRLTPVRQKNGGGNRFIAYADADNLKLKDLVENSPTVPSSGKSKIATPLVSQIHLFISFKRPTKLFFPSGKTTLRPPPRGLPVKVYLHQNK